MFSVIDISERRAPDDTENDGRRWFAAVKVDWHQATYMATYYEPSVDDGDGGTSTAKHELLVSGVEFLEDEGAIARYGTLTYLTLIYRPWLFPYDGLISKVKWLDLAFDEDRKPVAMHGLADGTVLKPDAPRLRRGRKQPFVYNWRRVFTAPDDLIGH